MNAKTKGVLDGKETTKGEKNEFLSTNDSYWNTRRSVANARNSRRHILRLDREEVRVV